MDLGRKTSHSGYRRPNDTRNWPPPPPEDPSEDAKHMRQEMEREAKRVSDHITSSLEAERLERKKRKSDVKILLIGQAESGKSTMLKNFQLNFTPHAFHAEAEAWRTVIHLNLVRSINYVLDLLSLPSPTSPTVPTSRSGSRSTGSSPAPILSSDIRRLKLSLLPLKSIESVLLRRLSAEPNIPSESSYASSSSLSSSKLPQQISSIPDMSVRVRSNSGWKRLARMRREDDTAKQQRDLEGAQQIIEACGEDMDALWRSSGVQAVLQQNGVSMKDLPGFFLNDCLRVTAGDYVPTSDDILRARLATIGVEEHRLKMESGPDADQEWMIYDCGGSRTQRAAWAPYFDDVNAVIFLAPISAFNESLAEDSGTNRLEDSLQLWRTICANRLMQDIEIILFLNKYDILDKKLKAGVRFGDWMAGYEDRSKQRNDAESVAKYLASKFESTHKHHSHKVRKLHVHMTSALNQKATRNVLQHVRDIIVIGHLTEASIL